MIEGWPLRKGRNEPCPCRSGKKYKKCCLLNPRPAPDLGNLLQKIRDGQLPFRAEVRLKDGSRSSVKVSDVKVIVDGVETTVVDDEITLSINDVRGDTMLSSAVLTVSLQADEDPAIRLHGNASVSNPAPRHSIEMQEGRQEWKIESMGGMYALIKVGYQRDEDFQYFDILFGAKGQPETVDSEGRKSRPHIALYPDGNGKFIRFSDYKCTLQSRLNYDPNTKVITPALINIDCQDFAEKLGLNFEYHPGDAKIVLIGASFQPTNADL